MSNHGGGKWDENMAPGPVLQHMGRHWHDKKGKNM